MAIKLTNKHGVIRSSPAHNARITALHIGPDGPCDPVVARNSEVQGSNPAEADICHGGCVYTVLQTVQRPVV